MESKCRQNVERDCRRAATESSGAHLLDFSLWISLTASERDCYSQVVHNLESNRIVAKRLGGADV